jgi:NAD(P)-dependent dehydrogenase (short-subunit alcohol dehydrogenase family)
MIVSGAFKETIKKFGALDIVVNNAGLCNDKSWRYTVSVNLVGKTACIGDKEMHLVLNILHKKCKNACLRG